MQKLEQTLGVVFFILIISLLIKSTTLYIVLFCYIVVVAPFLVMFCEFIGEKSFLNYNKKNQEVEIRTSSPKASVVGAKLLIKGICLVWVFIWTWYVFEKKLALLH